LLSWAPVQLDAWRHVWWRTMDGQSTYSRPDLVSHEQDTRCFHPRIGRPESKSNIAIHRFS
jgi:hypothetical protein